MSDTERGDRVRVVIAGNIYTKRALVKRFLADDGFRVVAEPATRPELSAALESTDPDAVVIDDGLLADDAGIAAIRRKIPSARIVVFTSGPEQKPKGADGYLEKGVGLATLTALLGRLCSDPTVSMNTMPLAGVGARSAESPAGPTFPRASSEKAHEAPRSALRAGAIGIGTVIVVVLASTLFSGGGSTPVGPPRANSSGGPILGHSPSALKLAQSDLTKLRDSLVSGSYLSARAYAQSLLRNRNAAITFGLSVSGLDERIRALLSPVMSSLAPRVIPFLRGTLGELLPPVRSKGGGGSRGGSTDTGGGGPGGSGTTVSGGSGGGGSGGGDDGQGGGGSGDGFPGQGKHLGWVHKPPQGGWHGHKPK
jgi:CheY-like chemotaxis protein